MTYEYAQVGSVDLTVVGSEVTGLEGVGPDSSACLARSERCS